MNENWEALGVDLTISIAVALFSPQVPEEFDLRSSRVLANESRISVYILAAAERLLQLPIFYNNKYIIAVVNVDNSSR